jgi:ADP-ribose pyrophosphatase YjhB (NUDIX family)
MPLDTCKFITGVALILRKNDEIFLYKRNIVGKIAYGSFALPGGTVEFHETIKQAACREAAEELGITINEKDLVTVHIQRIREKYDKITNQIQQILMLYFVEVIKWEGELQNLEPHKHSDLGWFEIDNLPQNLFSLNASALHDIKHGTFCSEHGWL